MNHVFFPLDYNVPKFRSHSGRPPYYGHFIYLVYMAATQTSSFLLLTFYILIKFQFFKNYIKSAFRILIKEVLFGSAIKLLWHVWYMCYKTLLKFTPAMRLDKSPPQPFFGM